MDLKKDDVDVIASAALARWGNVLPDIKGHYRTVSTIWKNTADYMSERYIGSLLDDYMYALFCRDGIDSMIGCLPDGKTKTKIINDLDSADELFMANSAEYVGAFVEKEEDRNRFWRNRIPTHVNDEFKEEMAGFGIDISRITPNSSKPF